MTKQEFIENLTKLLVEFENNRKEYIEKQLPLYLENIDVEKGKSLPMCIIYSLERYLDL